MRLESTVRRIYSRLTLLRAVRLILLAAVLLVLLAGLLERLVEPGTFHTYGRSLWWAVVTLTTVGYGDLVPVTTGGQIVAAVLMLFGLSLIPTITSVVVSALVSKATLQDRQELERDRRDSMAALSRIESRLADIETALGPKP